LNALENIDSNTKDLTYIRSELDTLTNQNSKILSKLKEIETAIYAGQG
jgi:hypothetical protein